jgi:hypothetical protein
MAKVEASRFADVARSGPWQPRRRRLAGPRLAQTVGAADAEQFFGAEEDRDRPDVGKPLEQGLGLLQGLDVRPASDRLVAGHPILSVEPEQIALEQRRDPSR